LKKSPEAALFSYSQLRRLLTALGPLQAAAEGAAPHLTDHVENTTLALRKQIRDALAATLDVILGKILWPKPGVAIPDTLLSEWDSDIHTLLALQRPELEAVQVEETVESTHKEPIVLLPLEVMVHPLETRFRYHFYGDRPTNRLDKPEYFLSHITDLLNIHSDFIYDSVQPAFLTYFTSSELALNPAYIDAMSAFITSLLPMVRTKIFSILPQASAQPQLLSHLIHELMSFDTNLRDSWNYLPDTSTTWKGLTWEVLVQQDWFGRWLQVEKDFALARYQSIVGTSDSDTLDFDSVSVTATKPTKAAIRVNDLLETITERYRPLTSFSQKVRFLVDIQISIFDRFHTRLHSSLGAYQSKISTSGRLVSGEDYEKTQGVPGLDYLCRVYGSADYIEKALRDWSDDVFFLDLWTELQLRSRANGRLNSAGAHSVADVAQFTSASLGMESSDNEASGALFDETAASYAALRVRSEGAIVSALVKSVKTAARFYQRSNSWTALSLSSEGKAMTVSPDLAPVLEVLETGLGFLGRALAALPLRRIVRQVAQQVEEWMWDNMVMKKSFSCAGGEQLVVDVQALIGVVERCVGGGCGERWFRKAKEAAELLALPVKESEVRSRESFGGDDSPENAAWDVDGAEADARGESGEMGEGATSLGLWEVEKRLFGSSDSARNLLGDLGMESLTEHEACSVLQRRVELG